MANISDVYGKLMFKKEDSKITQEILDKMLEFNLKWYYSSLNIVDYDKKFGKCYSFFSDGRWNFYTSLNTFFENFNNILSKEEKKLVNGFVISCDYFDFEIGCEYLAEASVAIKAELKVNELITKIIKEDFEFYNCNSENINELLDYDYYDTWTEYGTSQIFDYLSDPEIEKELKYYNEDTKKLVNKLKKMSKEELLNFFNEHGYSICDYIGSFIDYLQDNIEDFVEKSEK